MSDMIDTGRIPTLWRAFAGLGLWAVCFTVLYVGHALGCTLFITPSVQGILPTSTMTTTIVAGLATIWTLFMLGLVVMTVRSGAQIGALKVRVQHVQASHVTTQKTACPLQDPEAPQWRETRHSSLRFMLILTFVVDISSLGATLMTGLPIVFTPACV